MFASRTLVRRSLATLSIAGAALLAGCDILLVDPAGEAHIPLALSLVAGTAAGGSAEAFDAVDGIRIRIRVGQEIIDELEQPFDSDGGDVSVPIRAPSSVDGVPVTVEVELSRGADLLFTGQGQLTPDAAATNSAEIVLQPVAAAVLIDPPTALFDAFGQSITFRAAAVFATGDTIDGAPITFRALTAGILEVQADGVATARAEGTTSVEARSGDTTAEAEAAVQQRVTDILVERVPTSIAAGASFVIEATLRDRNGFEVAGRTVQWTSSDPSILAIDANNVARAVGTGSVTVTGTIDDASTSFQVVVAAIPVTPSGLLATAQGTVVSLQWRDNADNESAYEVLWRVAGSGPFAVLTTLAANATSFVANTFTPDARLEYAVRACNGADCSDNSNVAVVTTVPATPGSTSIDLDSNSFILTIAWSDTNTETFFILERDDFGYGSWALHAQFASGVTQVAIDAYSDIEARYAHWRIFACNAAGCSPPTASFSLYGSGSEASARVRRTIRR